MYPRFIQTMIDNTNFGLVKEDKDVMVLEHMDWLTLNKANSYRNVPEAERPPYKGPFGHVRDENYIAPDNDKWRHDDSNSATEDMDDYIAYRVESEVEGSPVVRQRKRPSQSTPKKKKKSLKTEAGSSSKRKGKQIVQEGDSEETETDSDSEATDVDSEIGERVIKLPGGPVRL